MVNSYNETYGIQNVPQSRLLNEKKKSKYTRIRVLYIYKRIFVFLNIGYRYTNVSAQANATKTHKKLNSGNEN